MKRYLLLASTAFMLLSCSKNTSSAQTITPPVVPVDTLPTGGNDGDKDMGDISAPGIFYDRFETALDTSKWDAIQKLWGQNANVQYQHGGVIKENAYTYKGVAVLRSLGDLYTGPLKGINGRGTRIGGVIATKQRFASGSYEVKMRILQTPDMGVLSTAWTFWYKEITMASDSAAYKKGLLAGNKPVNNLIILNHEVDIEVLGKDLALPYFTNWIGEKDGEFETKILPSKKLDDNAFHLYRFDWHTGGNGQQARVEYYIDNQLMYTSFIKVPYIAAHYNVGNWFAWWAGNTSGTYKAPLYDTKEMWVDWVKITPFNEPNDDWMQ